MSNNPFHDLADYLEALNSGAGTLSDRFNDLAEDGEEVRDVHQRIFDVYLHCRTLLKSQGKERSLQIVLLPVWDYLVRPDAHWYSEAPGDLPLLQIESVRLLGNDAGISRLLPKVLTPDELDALRMTFKKIQEIVNSYESIPEQTAAHIIYLCNRGIDLIKGESVDLVALRSLSFETITLVQAASVTLPEDAQRTIRESVLRLWKGWGYTIAQEVAANLLSAGAASVLGIGS